MHVISRPGGDNEGIERKMVRQILGIIVAGKIIHFMLLEYIVTNISSMTSKCHVAELMTMST